METVNKNVNNECVVLSELERKEILMQARHLEGHAAMLETFRFVDCPGDVEEADIALKAVMRFYSNAVYLVESLERLLGKDE